MIKDNPLELIITNFHFRRPENTGGTYMLVRNLTNHKTLFIVAESENFQDKGIVKQVRKTWGKDTYNNTGLLMQFRLKKQARLDMGCTEYSHLSHDLKEYISNDVELEDTKAFLLGRFSPLNRDLACLITGVLSSSDLPLVRLDVNSISHPSFATW